MWASINYKQLDRENQRDEANEGTRRESKGKAWNVGSLGRGGGGGARSANRRQPLALLPPSSVISEQIVFDRTL
jgi:hypothetical protein